LLVLRNNKLKLLILLTTLDYSQRPPRPVPTGGRSGILNRAGEIVGANPVLEKYLDRHWYGWEAPTKKWLEGGGQKGMNFN
jgi:hypothetical protein